MEVSSPCVYNCSLVLKTENRSLSKTINVSIHWKIRLSDGGFHKKTIKTRDCLKRKAWAVIRFKVGLVKKKGGGGVVFDGGLIQQCMLYFLTKLKGKGRRIQKGSDIVRLPPRARDYHKRGENLSFWEIWNNPTSPLCFITSPYR